MFGHLSFFTNLFLDGLIPKKKIQVSFQNVNCASQQSSKCSEPVFECNVLTDNALEILLY